MCVCVFVVDTQSLASQVRKQLHASREKGEPVEGFNFSTTTLLSKYLQVSKLFVLSLATLDGTLTTYLNILDLIAMMRFGETISDNLSTIINFDEVFSLFQASADVPADPATALPKM